MIKKSDRDFLNKPVFSDDEETLLAAELGLENNVVLASTFQALTDDLLDGGPLQVTVFGSAKEDDKQKFCFRFCFQSVRREFNQPSY